MGKVILLMKKDWLRMEKWKKLIDAFWQKGFLRFLVVGVLNTLFGYALYALFLFMGLHFTVAAFLATIIGILFNFKTTGVLVFKNKDNALVLKFFAVYGVVYCVNILFLAIFDSFSVSAYLAGAILTLPMAILSYLLMKKFVFLPQE